MATGVRGRLPLAVPLAVTILAIATGNAFVAEACPFCGPVGESLAQRRDAAAVVAVGEAVGTATADGEGGTWQRFRLDQVLRTDSANAQAGASVRGRVAGPVEGTALLFGRRAAAEEDRLEWSAIAADETLLGYVVSAPAVTLPAAERLRWFAARLEHPDPSIAADAFTEFGQAPFAAVRTAADALDADRLCAWLTEPGIDARRRGLYGLLLGVAAAATVDQDRRGALVEALRRAVATPADDFRAGFDGLLAGVLVAEGTVGLDFLREQGLFGPAARPLDQRHLLAALRFAGESLADTIPRERIGTATAALLKSPAVAADATIDLARYRAWERLEDVASLWDRLGADDPLIRRAVAGYLAACPLPAARQRLEALRERQPVLLQQALDAAALPAAR